MRPQVSRRRRFALLVVAWATLVMPTLVSTQSPQPQRVLPSAEVFGREPMSLLTMTVPRFNPITEDKAALGRRLFFEKALSRDRTVSCATCHDPERAFTDDRPIAIGVGDARGRRNTPTLINRGFGRMQFWDGRESALEEVVLEPIANPVEMNLPLADARARIAGDPAYRDAFAAVFGGVVSVDTISAALATYLRTIRSAGAPYDRFIDGERTALSADAQAGLTVFRTKGRCAMCHREPLFTTDLIVSTGVSLKPDGTIADEGRFTVTGRPFDRAAFKTPTLREVARTAPYMHDGSLATLADVIEFYDRGGRHGGGVLSILRPLALTTDEKRQLGAFLESLNGAVSGK